MIRFLKYILFPFTLLYWLITYIRNILFDIGITPQVSFPIPIISVGNITVGGTGKTPHVQYIINRLQSEYSIASLSRGYKRQSKGFVLATQNTTVLELGDEPFLLKQRFPQVAVAVCEKRVEGVQQILKHFPHNQVVVLDDAFQHRHIKPGLQIVLVDYNRPLWQDWVFPVGFLREGAYALKRADIVIVTKCPQLDVQQQLYWRKKLKIDQQKLFFTRIAYGNVYNAVTREEVVISEIVNKNHIVLVTGIAHPDSIIDYVETITKHYTHLHFADHYNYTFDDFSHIENLCLQQNSIVLTTEKDVYKLEPLVQKGIQIFVLPIAPEFLNNQQEQFDSLLTSYVQNEKE